RRRSGAVRGRDHRRSRALPAGLARHPALDHPHRHRHVRAADGIGAEHRVRADLPHDQLAQPLGRRRLRHLRVLHGHHAGLLQLLDRGGPVQGHRRRRAHLRRQRAGPPLQPDGDLLMAREKYRFNTPAGRVFDVFNIVLMVLISIVALVPFIYVLAGSFATESELATRSFFLWPETFSTEAYSEIFSSSAFLRALIATIRVPAVGTVVQLVLTAAMAYPLSKANLPGGRVMLSLIVFTMVFSGGMIPTFLVVKDLGLLDNYWALILPAAINPFSLIIIKKFFQQLRNELEESAKIDGANELQTLWSIVLPLSKPVLATFALFYAVGIWNDFMSPLLYLNDNSMWTLQMFLRQVTVATDMTVVEQDPTQLPPAQGIKFAVIIVATLPIILFYPFLQKHFAKGMLIGSV